MLLSGVLLFQDGVVNIFLQSCVLKGDGIADEIYLCYHSRTKIYSVIEIIVLFVLTLKILIWYNLGENAKKIEKENTRHKTITKNF